MTVSSYRLLMKPIKIRYKTVIIIINMEWDLDINNWPPKTNVGANAIQKKWCFEIHDKLKNELQNVRKFWTTPFSNRNFSNCEYKIFSHACLTVTLDKIKLKFPINFTVERYETVIGKLAENIVWCWLLCRKLIHHDMHELSHIINRGIGYKKVSQQQKINNS